MNDEDFFDAWIQIQDAELAQQRPDLPWAEWREHITWTRADDPPPGGAATRTGGPPPWPPAN